MVAMGTYLRLTWCRTGSAVPVVSTTLSVTNSVSGLPTKRLVPVR
jgi:hypothetical protein